MLLRHVVILKYFFFFLNSRKSDCYRSKEPNHINTKKVKEVVLYDIEKNLVSKLGKKVVDHQRQSWFYRAQVVDKTGNVICFFGQMHRLFDIEIFKLNWIVKDRKYKKLIYDDFWTMI